MVESGFGRRFHGLNHFEVGFFFTSLELIIFMRASSQNFVENHQFDVFLSYFKQILESHFFHITYLHATCTVF